MCKKILSLSLCSAMLLASIPTISANAAEISQPDYSIVSQASKSAIYGKVNCSSLTVRKLASVSSTDIAYLDKGTKVKIIGTDGAWYHISFTYKGESKIGFVDSNYIDIN